MNLFDMHCDTLYCGAKKGIAFNTGKTAVDFAAPGIENYVQVFAAFIEDETKDGFADFVSIYDYMRKSGLKPAVTPGDLQHRRCALFSVENGVALNGEIENLQKLYDCGVRIITLTWNGKNQIASGCGHEGPVTSFGRRVIDKMNALNMAVDLSHINGQGFDEAVELARFPIATHSCFYKVVPHRRNLTDERAKTLCEKGGIIGVCVYPEFMGRGNPYFAAAKQFEHGIKLGIADRLALGTDFDGADMHEDLAKTGDMCRLYEYLRKYFGDAGLVDAFFWGNAKEYFTRLLTKQDF